MKRVLGVALGLLLIAGLAGAADKADAVTIEGKVMCAKCKLKEEGQNKCQNVVVVENDGEKQMYYMAKTTAQEEFGEVCMATPTVRVTGTLEEKDGRTWIAATKIEPVEG